jgi:hypothetical protein
MDELALVARLRESIPARIDLTDAQYRLAEEIAAVGAAEASEHRSRGRRRPVARGERGIQRRLVAAGAITAAAAAAAALAAAVVTGHDQPARRTPTATGSTKPPTAVAPGPAATAAQLVAYATLAAAAGPPFNPRPHQWIYTKVLQAASSAGEGGYLFGPPNKRVTVTTWQRVDGLEVAYVRHGKVVISQSNLPRPAHGKVTYLVATPLGWPSATYPYLDSLPTNPGRLTALIKANLKAEPNPIGADGEGNVGVFNAIQALMQNVVLPPRLLAGLYGALARDPAVRFERSVTDIAGRSGVGFYTVQEGYLKEEIVINPRTYAYMGYQDVVIRAHTSVGLDMTSHFHKGQILGWEARLDSGIVQRPGQLP